MDWLQNNCGTVWSHTLGYLVDVDLSAMLLSSDERLTEKKFSRYQLKRIVMDPRKKASLLRLMNIRGQF
ncbi:hypothetical protein T4A_8286 [Trichinella pseudospiralis]|uniref:Uncharacterized protein n=1 Tax=Trichinella pseudospiralis TaxID=6337 RepID=A0A0V1ETP2_TRIPS|nr:hypothetical protein T4A_8286 [Trichinella pseudospiralis]